MNTIICYKENGLIKYMIFRSKKHELIIYIIISSENTGWLVYTEMQWEKVITWYTRPGLVYAREGMD